jgi:uncharacterized protein YkwD
MIELLIGFTLLINAERPVDLQPDIVLTIRAEERAQFLCESGQWSHDGWQESFTGLPVSIYGENLARNFGSRETAHQALMQSPTHKANILHPYYTKVGVGEECGIYVFLFSN